MKTGDQVIKCETSYVCELFGFENDQDLDLGSDEVIALVMNFNPRKYYVYRLHNYESTFVFNGLYYESLETDLKLPANTPIYKEFGLSLNDWPHKIYNPQRFNKPQ